MPGNVRLPAAMSQCKNNKFALTGPPGVGKTTIIKFLCDLLKQTGISTFGFYTEEVRSSGSRIGFDIIDVSGQRAILAREGNASHYKVGKYEVQIDQFESVALPSFQKVIDSPNSIIIIDEIGKMEIFSQKFVSEVRRIMSLKNAVIVMTIPIPKGKPIGLVEMIRKDPNVTLYEVNTSNRNEMPQHLFDAISNVLQC